MTVNDVLVNLNPFFCRSITFLLHQNGMDQPKQKRVWINQDVIDGSSCKLISNFAVNQTCF